MTFVDRSYVLVSKDVCFHPDLLVRRCRGVGKWFIVNASSVHACQRAPKGAKECQRARAIAKGVDRELGASINGGTPKSSILMGLSLYKPSILGSPNLWKPLTDFWAWDFIWFPCYSNIRSSTACDCIKSKQKTSDLISMEKAAWGRAEILGHRTISGCTVWPTIENPNLVQCFAAEHQVFVGCFLSWIFAASGSRAIAGYM